MSHQHLLKAIENLGATDKERAAALGTTTRNLQRWKKRPPKFWTKAPLSVLEAAIKDRSTEAQAA